jgi:micrococcal nuclease
MVSKAMKKAVIGFVVSLLLIVSAGCVPDSSEGTATVTKVIDGDTIEVGIGGPYYFYSVHRVRYIGIDAPEIDEAYYEEAKQKNEELVKDKIVTLQKDVSEIDKYGRLLRYVYVDETFVNAELVRSGLARAVSYPPDTEYQDILSQLQEDAKEAKRGIWANVV